MGPGSQKTTAATGMNGTPEPFNESMRKDLTGADIRFTTKKDVLYAFAMGHNSRETLIAALGPAPGLESREIVRVELLGSPEIVQWKLTSEGLGNCLAAFCGRASMLQRSKLSSRSNRARERGSAVP